MSNKNLCEYWLSKIMTTCSNASWSEKDIDAIDKSITKLLDNIYDMAEAAIECLKEDFIDEADETDYI